MVAFHAPALDGLARNPALPTPLLLRLLASSVGANPALPEDEMAAVLGRAGAPACPPPGSSALLVSTVSP